MVQSGKVAVSDVPLVFNAPRSWWLWLWLLIRLKASGSLTKDDFANLDHRVAVVFFLHRFSAEDSGSEGRDNLEQHVNKNPTRGHVAFPLMACGGYS